MKIISEKVAGIKLTTLAQKEAFEKPLSIIFTSGVQSMYFAEHYLNLREFWQNKNKSDLLYKTQKEDRNHLIKGLYTSFSVSSLTIFLLFCCYFLVKSANPLGVWEK